MDWKKGPIIGHGSSATVSLATAGDGRLFAVKSAELSNSRYLQKEQQLLSQLKSPYIIEYIGFDVDYDTDIPMYHLFMEYAPGGTISDVIGKHGGRLDECLIKSYAHRILLGLNYLHSKNLVHCDIKCQNILVTNDGVKIGDLGCAKLAKNGGDESSVFSGTPVFMAPEVARGEDQGFAADVWALGCAVIEMASGCHPWPEVNEPVSALYKIGYSGDVPLFPVWLSEQAKDFLDKCLRINSEERWSAKELLDHPFVNSNSGSENMESFSKDSPSSILDRGFWDAFEVPKPSPAMTQFEISGESPVDRIRQLACVTSCLPNWNDEEDWITVRVNQIDGGSKISQSEGDNDDSESTRSDSFLDSDLYVEEELSSFVRIMLESNNVLETSAPSIPDRFFSRFLDFKNMKKYASLIQIQAFFLSPSHSLHTYVNK